MSNRGARGRAVSEGRSPPNVKGHAHIPKKKEEEKGEGTGGGRESRVKASKRG